MLRRVAALLVFGLLATPALAGQILVDVDIQTQQMQVRVDGRLTYTFDVSTGRKGHSTPKGRYEVVRMYERYYSKKYDNAPMPYAIFFNGGYAIHGTNDIKHLGKIASHGCVRLHPDNARMLYDLVQQEGRDSVTIKITG
ncbi:L,D-transpeptidase [Devosia sp.]|uniref:L,D-transpeptidase n=1 Tax=Devosia sp. TaxID=1871048 RepID=UPI003BADAB4B